jgi:hypothetical protein
MKLTATVLFLAMTTTFLMCPYMVGGGRKGGVEGGRREKEGKREIVL